MQNKKNQAPVGLMIQRCHKWRQKRKQYMDQARQISDAVERERMMQLAEHYGRIVSCEQGKIDNQRDPREKIQTPDIETSDNADDDDVPFPDFIANLK